MKEIIKPKFLIEKEKLEKIRKAAPIMLEALKQIVNFPCLMGDAQKMESIAQAAIDAAEGKEKV